jgi:hypothetical protein
VANRDNFWQNVDATDPDKLADLSRKQRRYYEKYFLEIQYDPTLPQHEKQTATDRVALLRDQVSERRHKQNVGLAIAALLIAIAIAVFQYCSNRPSQNRNESAVSPSPTVTPAIPQATGPIPQATSVPSATLPDAGELGMTLEELNKKYEALRDRFAEQEALVTRLNHKRIKWLVQVLSVGKCHPGIFCVTFMSTTGSQFRITTAEFREEFKERLYALRKGDRIVLEGTLQANYYNSGWWVDATGFELAPARVK